MKFLYWLRNLFFYEEWLTNPECYRAKMCQEGKHIRESRNGGKSSPASETICDDGCVLGKRCIKLRCL